MSDILLSIIIPSYNTKKILLNCLESILKYTKDIKFEIIIVDNGSSDGSVVALKEYSQKNSQIILIESKENLGFGKANNLGARKARGEFLLFLNSDTLVFDNSLQKSVQDIKKHPKVGVYSCRLLNTDGSTQQSGGHFPNLLNLLAWQFFVDDLPLLGNLIPSFHPQKSQYDSEQNLDWVTGAYMIIPKEIFAKAGGFDEKIFMYTEEMELCFRINKLGYSTLLQSKPAIIHLGGASGGSVLALTSEVKYMIYFWQKHMPSWQLPLVRLAFFFGSLLRLLIFGIIKGDERARHAYVKAIRLAI